MAWQEEMGELLRCMVTDLNVPPAYPDNTVQRLLVASAQLVEGELDFLQHFVADIPNLDILPDPTDTPGNTRDDSFINLVCMKAASIIEAGVVRSESGLVIRDNGSMVDLRGKLEAALQMVKNGWKSEYEREKWAYQSGLLNGRVPGQAVMGPFRAFASDYYGWGGRETSARY